MGEQEDWVQPAGLNGLRQGEPTDSIFQVLDDRRWMIAEERAAELIACIKPTETSEQRRLAVADYVRKLIMQCIPCQVFTFGSVPLKTYLPDGDIDLTTFSWTLDLNDSWANDVRIMLESEEKNENAEYLVQEVQLIQAEVKIVKCLVEGIVVDISFNQIGGLCTLCFLEEVDHFISHNHLFKRSIILIKAWCYYESRILGAHHGLISTYALETLVLYIFHVFNDTFKGPLEVLYRFLEFFSKFDWENFCVSLWGPVPLDSLPEITAEPPRKDSRQLLLENAFLEKCTYVYGYNSHQEHIGAHFPKRTLNVVDPLRLNNNLGRSVSKGNFFRIRCAFAFGAKKLARLRDCQEEDLYAEVNQFFSNTWQRHGNSSRPDAPCKVPKSMKPSSPDSSKYTVEERRESCSGETKHASIYNHDNARKMHTFQISLGTSSQIVRNHSSPGIVNVASEPASRLKPADSKNREFSSARCDSINRNVIASEAQGHHKTSLSGDRRISSCPASDYATDSEVSSSSYQNSSLDGQTLIQSTKEHFSEDEQDHTKIMTSSMFHGFDGHFHLPFYMQSGHLPFAVTPSDLASWSSNQKNVEGMFKGNFPVVENPWGINMQFPAIPPATTHYFHGPGISKTNGGINPVDSTSLEFDSDYKVWHDHDRNSNQGFDMENGTLEVPFDDQHQSIMGDQLQGKHESFRNNTLDHHYRDHIENEVEETVDSMNLSSAEACDTKLSRTSWDGTAGKVLSVIKERRGKNFAQSYTEPAAYERPKIVSECASIQSDDDDMYVKDGKTIANITVSGTNEFQPIYTLTGQNNQLPRVELPLKIGMETRIDNVSGELDEDSPRDPPFRFIPAGPPVPFLATLIYNVPNGTRTKSNIQVSDYQNPGSAEPRRWDTFDSNLLTHLQILTYARSCLASQNNQRLGYPPQFTQPPTYWIPSGATVRPLPANMNPYPPFTGGDDRYIPVAVPVASMPIRPPADYQPCVDEMPRYRGTGTYLPNPKINVRDRKLSGNRRVNYNYDRNDQHIDKGGNWNHNKPRAAGRNHIQSQYDKGGPRTHRPPAGESRSEKSWGGLYRRPDSEFPYQSHVDSLHSPTPSQSGSADVAYDTYSLPACNAKGVSQSLGSVPSLMMMYPYSQKVDYNPQHQVLEFGSLGHVDLPSMKEYSLAKDASLPARVPDDLRLTFNDN